MPTPPVIAERHLVALWTAIRDAADAVEANPEGALASAELAPVRAAIAASARRLSQVLETGPRGSLPRPELLTQKPAVLVVDDDATAVASLATLLASDFRVVGTTDPEEVPRLAREHCVDAVVTDLFMPGLDGLALLELLRGGAPKDAVPPAVLVMSGSADRDQRVRAFSMGAFDFIAKPLDLTDLIVRIRRAVQFSRDLKKEHALQESDALTGLFNRRGLSTRLLDALEDRRRGSLAVALIDQDGLKRVNDRFGHGAGDQAIQHVAGALKATQRATDVAARLGGDEFALVMPDTDRAGAERVLQRVEEVLANHPLERGDEAPIPLAVSWGISVATPQDRPTDGSALMERADAALYAMKRAKHSGRGA